MTDRYPTTKLDKAVAVAITHSECDEVAAEDERECQGHPAGPFDPMGETVYCDGTCRGVVA